MITIHTNIFPLSPSPSSITLVSKLPDQPSSAFGVLSILTLLTTISVNLIYYKMNSRYRRYQDDEDRLVEVHEEEDQDTRGQIVAPVVRRDEDEDTRMFFGKVIRHQGKEIKKVSKKNDILMAIALTLAIMVLGTFTSTLQCGANSENEVEQYEKLCISQHLKYNCNSIDKKDLVNAKICEEMTQCLKDPHAYKVKMDEAKWNEMIDEILYYFNLTRSNSLLLGVCFVIFAIVKYLKIK